MPAPHTSMNIHMFSSSPSNSTAQNGNPSAPTPNGNLSASKELSPQPNGVGQQASSPGSPNGDNSRWSSAIGPTTTATTAKSGRVIEKLMTDRDNLQREMRTLQTKNDELLRSVQAERKLKNDLQDDNNTLRHSQEVDKALLGRRDRQINDLKKELKEEKEKRQAAETRSRQVETERDEAVEGKNRDVGLATERMMHSDVHAKILETSHRQLRREYKTRTQTLQTEMNGIGQKEHENQQKLVKLDIVSEQIRQHNEQIDKTHADMMTLWDAMKEVMGQRAEEMEQEYHSREERATKLSTEMAEALDEMRRVIGIKKNTNLDESD
ncbi:hypothetical protein CB0940_00881 [Lecanosticta acicola]|uniref:SWI5-dependent HO expression protein 3 n=1 Tax=Lecanosticta acicola TaxID=111012 RepID=A0AAI8Z455_9PEZI|nr:hypothetical protein CB0940_00881 [Lecanosticta acicola]